MVVYLQVLKVYCHWHLRNMQLLNVTNISPYIPQYITPPTFSLDDLAEICRLSPTHDLKAILPL